jgi:hypothetical protein
MITTAHHWSLSWVRWNQSTLSHPSYRRSILMLSFHLQLGVPSALFPSGFPTKTLCGCFISPKCARQPITHSLGLITLIMFGEAHKFWSIFQPLAISSYVKIFSLAPCSQRPSICASPFEWESTFHTLSVNSYNYGLNVISDTCSLSICFLSHFVRPAELFGNEMRPIPGEKLNIIFIHVVPLLLIDG